MTEDVPDEPVDFTPVDDPIRVSPLTRYIIDAITGHLSILSPPGTPPVTSEDVKRYLEDFP